MRTQSRFLLNRVYADAMLTPTQSAAEAPMKNWNWLMVFAGMGMVIIEVILGAATGFDFALMGGCLILGGAAGLLAGSVKVGLAATAVLGSIYIIFLRKYIRSKLTATDKPSNVDSILGRKGIVVEPVTPDKAGQVKVGDELWRATLVDGVRETKSAGESVQIESIDGVTLHVR